MKRFARSVRVFWVVSLLVFLSACNLPGREPQGEDQSALHTQAAQTISVQLTAQAGTIQALDTPNGSQPTLTLTPQQVPPTVTLAPAFTSTASATLLPTNAVSPTLTARLVFEDDFSSDNTWWYEDDGDDFGFKLTEDGYLIYINILNAPIWSVREHDAGDVVVEVEAARIDGAEDGYYGVVCRHQGEDDYYALVISPDGSYGIAKMENGEFEFIAEGSDQSGVIVGGDGANRVRGECIGETLTLYANGQKLLAVEEDDLPSGEVGVLAGTRVGGGVEVLFTYFAILEP